MGDKDDSASVGSYNSSVTEEENQREQDDAGSQDGDYDMFENNNTVLYALFGVLYTISKEKLDENWRFAVVKIAMDYIQLVTLMITPTSGWNLDLNHWPWAALKYTQFDSPMTGAGYPAFIGLVYIVVALLVASCGICLWVGWSFKNNHFSAIWPVKVVRVVVSVFFTAFYVSSLQLFLEAFNCSPLSHDKAKAGHLGAFKNIECFSMPHLAHAGVALVSSMILTTLAVIVIASDFELNPLHASLLATPDSTTESMAHLLRTTLTIASVLLHDYPTLQAVITFSSLMLVCILYLRRAPYYNMWTNHVRSGLYAALAWVGLLLVVMQRIAPPVHSTTSVPVHDPDLKMRQQLTTIMLVGQIPVFLLSFLLSYVRLVWRMKATFTAFKNMQPTDKWKHVYRFTQANEVEIASRCCRKWVPGSYYEELDAEHTRVAELILQGGAAQVQNNAFLTIVYSNFLISVKNEYQAGHTQLQLAKKMNPSILLKFAIFVREQEHRQKAQSNSTGETTGVDLMSYVEFQRNYKLLVRAHSSVLVATKSFWQQLTRREVNFLTLLGILKKIDSSALTADKMYKMVIDRYPNSIKLLQSYSSFLEEVKLDPWAANRMRLKIEKLEADQADKQTAGGDEIEYDSGDQAGHDAVIVISAAGIVRMANQVALTMFGYKKEALEGKNINILIPSPWSQRHGSYLAKHSQADSSKISDVARDILATHKDGSLLPLKLVIKHVAGTGSESVYMGIFRSLRNTSNVATIWANAVGCAMCVNDQFTVLTGYTLADTNNRPISELFVDSQRIIKILDEATQPTDEAAPPQPPPEAVQTAITHKYMDPADVKVSVRFTGYGEMKMLVLDVEPTTDSLNAKSPSSNMVLASNGNILWSDATTATMFGYNPKEMLSMSLANLLPKPFDAMHASWLKASASKKAPANSCSTGIPVPFLQKSKKLTVARLGITNRETSDDSTEFVVTLHKSSIEEYWGCRRVSLLVDGDGVVRQLSAANSTTDVFGFPTSCLVGQHVSAFINVFAEVQAQDQSATDMLLRAKKVSEEEEDLSFRVGVFFPMGEKFSSMKAAVMVVASRTDTHDPTCIMEVQLWRADMLEGILELNTSVTVTKVGLGVLYQPSLLLGKPSWLIERKTLEEVLGLGKGLNPTINDLLATKTDATSAPVSSSLRKGTAKAKLNMLGAPNRVATIHADGKELLLTLQAARKEETANSGVVLRLSLQHPEVGSVAVFKSQVFPMAVPPDLLIPDALIERKLGSTSSPSGSFGRRRSLQRQMTNPARGTMTLMGSYSRGNSTTRLVASLDTGQPAPPAFAGQDDGSNPNPTAGGTPAVNPKKKKGVSWTRLDGDVGIVAEELGNITDMLRGDGDDDVQALGSTGQPDTPARLSEVLTSGDGSDKLHYSKSGTKEVWHGGKHADAVSDDVASNNQEDGADAKPVDDEADHKERMETLLDLLDGPGHDEIPAPAPWQADEDTLPLTGESLKMVGKDDGAERLRSWIARSGEAGQPPESDRDDAEGAAGMQNDAEDPPVGANGLPSTIPPHDRPEDKGDKSGKGGSAAEGGGALGKDASSKPVRTSSAWVTAQNVIPTNQPADDDDALSRADSAEQTEVKKEASVRSYKKSKKYKKLLKFFQKGPYSRQNNIAQFFQRACAVVAALFVVHIAFFMCMVLEINNKARYSKELYYSIGVKHHIHLSTAYARTLQQLHLGTTATGIYTPSEIDYYGKLLTDMTLTFDHDMDGLYMNPAVNKENLNKGDRMLVGAINSPAPRPLMVMNDSVRAPAVQLIPLNNLTVWTSSQHYMNSLRSVFHNHKVWTANGTDLATFWDWWLVVWNGPRVLVPLWDHVEEVCGLRAQQALDRLAMLSITLFLCEGVLLSVLAAMSMWYLLKQVQDQRYALFDIFIEVPIGFIRQLSTQEIHVGGEDEGQVDENNEEHKEAEKKEVVVKPIMDEEVAAAAPKPKNRRASMIVDAAALASMAASTFFKGSSRISEWIRGMAQVAGLVKPKNFKKRSTRRKLVENAADTKLISATFLSWAIMLSIFYGIITLVIYQHVHTIEDIRAAYETMALASRTVLFSQELVTSPPENLLRARQELNASLHLLSQSYYAMVYGGVTEGVSGKRQSSGGTMRSSNEHADALFDPVGPCKYVYCDATNDTFYQAAVNGIDSMMQRLFQEVGYLKEDADDLVKVGSERFRYIWGVGLKDLIPSLEDYSGMVSDGIAAAMIKSKTLHIILFVLALAFVTAFIMLLLRPYVKQVSLEIRLVASLLAHLPPEVNSEMLVMQCVNRRTKQAPAAKVQPLS